MEGGESRESLLTDKCMSLWLRSGAVAKVATHLCRYDKRLKSLLIMMNSMKNEKI